VCITTDAAVYWNCRVSLSPINMKSPPETYFSDCDHRSGRPSSSHYFIGVQGLYFFYLDPHYTRSALPYHQQANEYTRQEIDTCHTRKLRRLHIREMDPSMLIGFLIRDEEDWTEWRRGVKHVQGKAIIHVSDHDPVAQMSEQGSAIDQVETLSDDDGETVLDESTEDALV